MPVMQSVDMTQTGPQALAEAAKARRLELGLSQTDLQSRGGPGVVTVGKIERGVIASPLPTTLRGLDRSLRWKAGSAAGTLTGRAPQPLADGEDPPGSALIAAIRNDPDLLPEAKEHLERQYGLLLRVQATQPPAGTAETAAAIEDATQTVRAINAAKKRAAGKTPTKRR